MHTVTTIKLLTNEVFDKQDETSGVTNLTVHLYYSILMSTSFRFFIIQF